MASYAELCAQVQQITENTFTADQLALFFKNAEQKIYNTVDLPLMRETVQLTATQGVFYLTQPSDLLHVYSLAVIFVNDYQYLLPKDEAFIREAYPDQTIEGTPRYYAFVDDTTFIIAPTPDDNYTMPLTYARYPESIVTAGTTWLGTLFDTALLNGAVLEALRFMKSEKDIIETSEAMYVQSVSLLSDLAKRKLRTDTYRTGPTLR